MKLIVNPHKIELEKTPVNEKEIDITKCQFEFSDEITNDYVKEAYFTLKGETYKQIIVNNKCSIPYEVLATNGTVEIGVVAYKVEDEEEIKRYNPSPAYFDTWVGSLKEDAENSEPITPSEMEQYEQALQDGLSEVNGKLEDINQALEDVNTAITETNNLDLDVSKEGKTATVTLTKKNATQKVVTLSDGTSLMFNWDGTKLGIKTDEDEEYTYVDLQGVQGEQGPMGAPFTIKKTYTSVAEMNADFNNMQVGDYVMITSTVEVEDNAKLYCRGEAQWIFITDFSGATGIQGPVGATPNIQIGTVTQGDSFNVTRSGTNENPILNFTLVKGDKGDPGQTGATGNGIASITKTGTSGLIDTYTILYTNGNSTTFTVTNGNGIASIVKSSTSGYVDTYTITYTNGQTTTFDVTNGEVSQEELDNLERKVEHYKEYSNALIKNTSSGTSLIINDTIKAPMELELNPSELSQETTTGKNLIPFTVGYSETKNGVKLEVKKDGIYLTGTPNISSGYISFNFDNNLEVANYTAFFPENMDGLGLQFTNGNLNYSMSDTTITPKNVSNGTATTGIGSINVRHDVGTLTNKKITPMLVKGTYTTQQDYEPYTNGASPNPSYPQTIHSISENNTILISNKNLLSNAKIVKGRLDSGVLGYDSNTTALSYTENSVSFTTNANYRGITSDYIEVVASADYVYSQTTSLNDYSIATACYDENKTFLGNATATNIDDYSKKYTMLVNTKYFRFNIQLKTAGSTTINNLQFEKGTTKSTYTSNKEQNYSLTLGDLEYCKIDNYSDEIKQSTGKSLIDFNTITYNSNNATITRSNGEISVVGSSQSYASCQFLQSVLNLKPSTTYTLSAKVKSTTNSNGSLVYSSSGMNSNNTQKWGTQVTANNISVVTFTTPSTIDNSAFIGLYTGGTNNSAVFTEIMLEENSTATEYEPYGYGVWYLKKNISSISNLTLYDVVTTYDNLDYLPISKPSNYKGYGIYAGYKIYYESAKYKYISTIDSTSNINMICSNTHPSRFWLGVPKGTTKTSMETALANKKLYYPLTTPTYILLNDTLQEELDNIELALSYDTQTNITQVNNDLPFVIGEVNIKDTKTYIDNAISTSITSALGGNY